MSNKKLDRFTTAILSDAAAESQRTKAEIEVRRKEALSAAEHEILIESYQYVHNEVARIQADAGRSVSGRMLEAKRALYLRRDAMAHEVFDQVRSRIGVYTTSEAYVTRLGQLLQEGLAALPKVEDIEVGLRKEDMEYAPKLSAMAEGVNLSFVPTLLTWGGLVVQSATAGLRCDLSFDSQMEELESHFAELFGLSLSDLSDQT